MDLDEPVEESGQTESVELNDPGEGTQVIEPYKSTDDFTPSRKSAKINRSRAIYIRKSITRLSVISDRPLKTKSDVCSALEDYGYCLPPEQRAALEKWCNVT
ncbi:MAG: hypothetical protein WBM52_10010 [Thiogranum sp.]|jgi:hypothetical protein